MSLGARIAALAMVTALAGCGTPPTAAPWAGRNPDEVVRVTCIRRDFVGNVGEEELEIPAADRPTIARAIIDAVEMPADKVGLGVAGIRYTLDCVAPGASWRIALDAEDLFVHVRGSGPPGRRYRAPRLRAMLEAAFARWDASSLANLASFQPRLERFCDRARARSAHDGAAVELVLAARPGEARLADGTAIAADPRRLILAGPAGRELGALPLPAGVTLHAGYELVRIAFAPDGTSAVAGAPDRDDHLAADDPVRLQPYPLYYDLVLAEPATGRMLYADVGPRAVRFRLR